jgi:hypothetical protein
MSEMKAEQWLDYAGEPRPCYPKSEADKVIAEKDKRCLAMARWCESRRVDSADCTIPKRKWEFFARWHKRWLELAEKFKEVK